MKKVLLSVLMALVSIGSQAQSCDAAYPVGPWQTHYDYDLMGEIVIDRVTTPNPEFGNRKGCGVLYIRDNKTDNVLFGGILSYVGKSVDKNGYPLPIYNFDVVTKQGKTCKISIQKFKSKEGSYGNGMEIKILDATGELSNDTILKKPLYLVGHGYTEDVTINAEGEKDLLGRLKKVLDDKFGWADGFGDVQHFRQYINAHAQLDPTKYKYAKCKGNSAVNIRESYNTQSKKIGELKPETTLLVMDEYDGWCLVKMEDGKYGCVSLSVVTLTNTPAIGTNTSMGKTIVDPFDPGTITEDLSTPNNPENPDNDSIISQKRNFSEFNIIEFASQMIQLNDFDKIREQALANSFKPSTDKDKYFSAKRTIGKKENIHTDRFSKKDPKVYVVSTFISEWDDNEIISTLQRLGYTETEVKNSTIAGAPRVTRIYQHRSGQHYVEFDIVNSSTEKTFKELKYKNK